MRGIHLEGKKESSLISWSIRKPTLPSKVRIPLCDQRGIPAVPLVRAGSRVLTGEKIAETNDLIPIAIHASVSGRIARIQTFPHPVFEKSQAIEIISDGRDETIDEMRKERPRWQHLSREELFCLFHEQGLQDVVYDFRSSADEQGMTAQSRVLILNACESEPYLTSDHALLMSQPVEILKGAEILRRFLNAEKIVFAIEDNKMEVAELLKSKIYFLKWRHIEVKILPSLYPQGLDSVLLQTVTGISARETREKIKNEARIFNPATAFAVYEAVAQQKPRFERVVTLGGECMVDSKNLWLRHGTTFEDAIKACRGLLRQPRKILMGGPMQGIAQSTLDVPVLEGTTAILALPKEVAAPEKIEPCIRCGLCVEVCPVEISPVLITLAAERELFDVAEQWGASACIECGNCSYICPSKRPMLELIRYAHTHATDQTYEGTPPYQMPGRPGETIKASVSMKP